MLVLQPLQVTRVALLALIYRTRAFEHVVHARHPISLARVRISRRLHGGQSQLTYLLLPLRAEAECTLFRLQAFESILITVEFQKLLDSVVDLRRALLRNQIVHII